MRVFGRTGGVDLVADRLLEHLPEASVSRRSGRALVVSPLPPGSTHLVAIEIGTPSLTGVAGEQERRQLAEALRSGALEGPGLGTAVDLVPELQVAVSLVPEGVPDDATLAGMWDLASVVAGWVEGFSVAPDLAELRGPDGSVWATGPEAARPAAAPLDGGATAPAEGGPAAAPDHGDPDRTGPSLGRVVARLLALVAVSARSLSERDGHHDPGVRAAVLAWCAAVGIDAELEPAEVQLLQAPGGDVTAEAVIDGSWSVEAAAVLAWALSLLPLPEVDRLVDPGELIRAVGFPDATRTIAVLASARLRPSAELDELRRALATVHWRVRELVRRPEAIDLVALAAAEDLPLDPAGLRLVDGDLAVGDGAISAAEPAALRLLTSTVLERHRAANWLAEGGVLGDTSTAT
ncbi:DUF4272 domain-containing protein [Aquihabitans sp. G128]|uniref:DUF4272 domain-containing protein n=1 Tax=Aquihabitans sp. G128 TaxID=2849779 RepID=UPI001C226BDE|nr:DUF4272 domain-containing protein [Aquihabitans sp. G128]QXC59969.1 DUF4272 domain-containing protein [Aquihabitans sp. G128]